MTLALMPSMVSVRAKLCSEDVRYAYAYVIGGDDDDDSDAEMLQYGVHHIFFILSGDPCRQEDEHAEPSEYIYENSSLEREDKDRHDEGRREDKFRDKGRDSGFPYVAIAVLRIGFLGEVDAERIGKCVRDRDSEDASDDHHHRSRS